MHTNSVFIPRLHDTTGCQTGCQTGLTTGCKQTSNQLSIRLTSGNRFGNRIDNRLYRVNGALKFSVSVSNARTEAACLKLIFLYKIVCSVKLVPVRRAGACRHKKKTFNQDILTSFMQAYSLPRIYSTHTRSFHRVSLVTFYCVVHYSNKPY